MAVSNSSSRRGSAVAAFALLAGVLPAAWFTTSPAATTYQADCAVGFYWDTVNMVCAPVVVDPVPVVDPVVGPVGPVGVGGVVGPVGVDPVLGPAGPVGVGRR